MINYYIFLEDIFCVVVLQIPLHCNVKIHSLLRLSTAVYLYSSTYSNSTLQTVQTILQNSVLCGHMGEVLECWRRSNILTASMVVYKCHASSVNWPTW
jgi:hypothetical protein